MEAKDFLSFAIDRASAINVLWNLWLGVATGVVGFMVSGKEFTQGIVLRAFVSVAFGLFAYSNLNAILRLGNLREALLQAIPLDLPNRAAIIEGLSPAEPVEYITFHVVIDVVVLGVIWAAPFNRLVTKLRSARSN